jgi:hypothetical protein
MPVEGRGLGSRQTQDVVRDLEIGQPNGRGGGLLDYPRRLHADRRCVYSPGGSNACAGTSNLRFLRIPAGHPVAPVTEIAGKRGGMPMQAGALSAGAEMGDAIGDDEIPRVEQRPFAHAGTDLV